MSIWSLCERKYLPRSGLEQIEVSELEVCKPQAWVTSLSQWIHTIATVIPRRMHIAYAALRNRTYRHFLLPEEHARTATYETSTASPTLSNGIRK